MNSITCEIPSVLQVSVNNNNDNNSNNAIITTTMNKPRVVGVSPWMDENKKNSTIQLETSESRGYVVSIILNSTDSTGETKDVEEVPLKHSGGATTVLHVSGEPSAAGSGDGREEDMVNSYNVGRVSGSCIKISLGGGISEETTPVVTTANIDTSDSNMVRPGHFFYFPDSQLSGGLSSPSDTNDSGAGSDFDGSTPPPLPKRKQQASPVDSGVSSVATHRSDASLLTDEDEEVDSISCDSLNSSELNGDSILHPPSPPELTDTILSENAFKLGEQIRSLQLHEELPPASSLPVIVSERTYAERTLASVPVVPQVLPDHHHYDFHLRENIEGEPDDVTTDTFAGVKDVLGERGAIKSARGTVRGVKNRVRAGIATFLQLEDTKSYKDREQGKLVVYTTTMGVVRATYLRCVKVKQILRTLLVKFEERDVFMSRDIQQEIRTRMKCNAVVVPQVFLEGHHLGDADTIERLNESGELRRLLRPFKCPGASIPCAACGGYRLLPCSSCRGSKKSVHRNHFTAEFVALKCMACDESGLVRCHACS